MRGELGGVRHDRDEAPASAVGCEAVVSITFHGDYLFMAALPGPSLDLGFCQIISTVFPRFLVFYDSYYGTNVF